MGITEGVRSLYPRLIAGDIGVLSMFGDRALVDTPLSGKQEPARFVAETRAWLERHAARVDDVATTVTPERVVHELTLRLAYGDESREVPLMLVAEVDGDHVRDLRVYHSTWPLFGTHAVRTPMIQYDLDERPPEPVGTYHEALAAGDAGAVDALFEAEGSVREPSGSAFEHRGRERTEWYRTVLSDGGLGLRIGTITDDGTTVVCEYELDRWGHTVIPAQAGAAAYTRAPSGRLASVRIYDDIEPPSTLGRSQ